MPKLNGMEVKIELNHHESTAAIPVVFLTAKDKTQDKVAGLNLGADDYVTKPFEMEELLARVGAILGRRKFYEAISMTDKLTGLYNRKKLSSIRMKQFDLIYLDLDGLKKVNDTKGHAVGDLMIIRFAQAINQIINRHEQAFRVGGDEFVIVVKPNEGQLFVDRLEHELQGENIRFSYGIEATNINELTQRTVSDMLSFQAIKEEFVQQILSQRLWLEKQLLNIAVVEKVYPSEANFLLVKFQDARQAYECLLANKVIVRDRSNIIRCSECLRITVGTPEQNKLLIKTLSSL